MLDHSRHLCQSNYEIGFGRFPGWSLGLSGVELGLFVVVGVRGWVEA